LSQWRRRRSAGPGPSPRAAPARTRRPAGRPQVQGGARQSRPRPARPRIFQEAVMTITTNTGTVSVALESFAELPDWLAALMRPNRLADSLRRHVPEIADGRLEIVSCRADQLRAKDDQWHVRCRLSVARSEPS